MINRFATKSSTAHASSEPLVIPGARHKDVYCYDYRCPRAAICFKCERRQGKRLRVVLTPRVFHRHLKKVTVMAGSSTQAVLYTRKP